MINWTHTNKNVPLLASARGRIGFRHLALALVDTLLGWQARARQRTLLARLDPRMLKDIGLSPYNARIEARKPFWRA